MTFTYNLSGQLSGTINGIYSTALTPTMSMIPNIFDWWNLTSLDSSSAESAMPTSGSNSGSLLTSISLPSTAFLNWSSSVINYGTTSSTDTFYFDGVDIVTNTNAAKNYSVVTYTSGTYVYRTGFTTYVDVYRPVDLRMFEYWHTPTGTLDVATFSQLTASYPHNNWTESVDYPGPGAGITFAYIDPASGAAVGSLFYFGLFSYLPNGISAQTPIFEFPYDEYVSLYFTAGNSFNEMFSFYNVESNTTIYDEYVFLLNWPGGTWKRLGIDVYDGDTIQAWVADAFTGANRYTWRNKDGFEPNNSTRKYAFSITNDLFGNNAYESSSWMPSPGLYVNLTGTGSGDTEFKFRNLTMAPTLRGVVSGGLSGSFDGYYGGMIEGRGTISGTLNGVLIGGITGTYSYIAPAPYQKFSLYDLDGGNFGDITGAVAGQNFFTVIPPLSGTPDDKVFSNGTTNTTIPIGLKFSKPIYSLKVVGYSMSAEPYTTGTFTAGSGTLIAFDSTSTHIQTDKFDSGSLALNPRITARNADYIIGSSSDPGIWHIQAADNDPRIIRNYGKYWFTASGSIGGGITTNITPYFLLASNNSGSTKYGLWSTTASFDHLNTASALEYGNILPLTMSFTGAVMSQLTLKMYGILVTGSVISLYDLSGGLITQSTIPKYTGSTGLTIMTFTTGSSPGPGIAELRIEPTTSFAYPFTNSHYMGFDKIWVTPTSSISVTSTLAPDSYVTSSTAIVSSSGAVNEIVSATINRSSGSPLNIERPIYDDPIYIQIASSSYSGSLVGTFSGTIFATASYAYVTPAGTGLQISLSQIYFNYGLTEAPNRRKGLFLSAHSESPQLTIEPVNSDPNYILHGDLWVRNISGTHTHSINGVSSLTYGEKDSVGNIFTTKIPLIRESEYEYSTLVSRFGTSERPVSATLGLNAFVADQGFITVNTTGNSGSGWLNATWSGGVYMPSSDVVSIFGSNKDFQIPSGSIIINEGSMSVRNITYIWPSSDGPSGSVLTTDGAGNLIWLPASGSSTISSSYAETSSVALGANQIVPRHTIYFYQAPTTTWTTISSGTQHLAESGLYLLDLYIPNDGYHIEEHYAGVMSWYTGSTNSTGSDGITLHRAGQTPNDAILYIQTQRELAGSLLLQISSSVAYAASSSYSMSLVRIL